MIQSFKNRSLILALVMSMSIVYADNLTATIEFNPQGFSVSGPDTATMLQVRLMSPQRKLIYSDQTTGSSLSWQQNGYEVDGDYRYQAITVTDNDGSPQQHTLAGGFEIQDGILIVPPTATVPDDLAYDLAH